MTTRPWVSTWLSPLALSNTSILLASLIGGFGTLVLVPGTSGLGVFSWQWLAVTVASQVAFASVLILARVLSSTRGPWLVLLALSIGGAIRGLVIALGGGFLGIMATTASSVAGRAINSAVISVIGVALIGATLAWRAQFRAQYQLLRNRAVLIGNAAQDGETIDPHVLDAWTTMKGDLDTTLRTASERLAAGATRRDLYDAADLLTSAIDVRLRPTARAMWQETIPEDEPIRLRPLFIETIGRWRPPLLVILGFLAVVVGIGSIVRSGLLYGGAYTVRYVIVVGLVLWASTGVARAKPRLSSLIAVVTLVALPPIVLLCDHFIGDELLGLPEDPTGQIVVALQTPITTVFIAMAVEAVRDRQQVLASLQARIDIEAAELRRSNRLAQRDAQRLSLFVHHSVQSELAALAMQVREAASTGDVAAMDDVRLSALERLQRLEQLDAHTPPWLGSTSGRERIEQVVDGWSALLDIRLDLPPESSCRPDQWHLAAQIIEEGLANAARHGGADHVTITGRPNESALELRLADNGTHGSGPRQASAGLGTQWLDRIAPGDWRLERTADGSVLSVVLR